MNHDNPKIGDAFREIVYRVQTDENLDGEQILEGLEAALNVFRIETECYPRFHLDESMNALFDILKDMEDAVGAALRDNEKRKEKTT